MYIKRELDAVALEAAQAFPVIGFLGPRQSGKTTLAKNVFPKHAYVSLEDPDIRMLAQDDPRRLLTAYASEVGLIIDEIQHVPQLLSYIQTKVDVDKKKGFYILTGSQNILVNQAVSQTLAGRIAVLTLLPLSIKELHNAELLASTMEKAVFEGGYPQMFSDKAAKRFLYGSYINTYVERDIRLLKNIQNLSLFKKFMGLCAGRIGQLVNTSSLANEVGVSHTTIKDWLSLLEATYVIFLLQPYYKNFGKRLIKSPKLYFVDTGLACSLLKLQADDDLLQHYLRGSLFENYIVSDVFKQQYNQALSPSVYFWRDQTGNEIDCILETAHGPRAIEIKAASTITPSFFKELTYWDDLTGNGPSTLVYTGTDLLHRHGVSIVPWPQAGDLVSRS